MRKRKRSKNKWQKSKKIFAFTRSEHSLKVKLHRMNRKHEPWILLMSVRCINHCNNRSQRLQMGKHLRIKFPELPFHLGKTPMLSLRRQNLLVWNGPYRLQHGVCGHNTNDVPPFLVYVIVKLKLKLDSNSFIAWIIAV